LAVVTRHHGFDVKDVQCRAVGGEQLFFPTRQGVGVRAALIAAFFRKADKCASIAQADIEEKDAQYGGHSFRRTGCQMWHTLGMPDDLLRRLARWRSIIIEAYLGQAPLANLGTWSFAGKTPLQRCEWAGVVPVQMEKVLSEMRKLTARVLKQVAAKAAKPESEEKAAPVGEPLVFEMYGKPMMVVTRAPGKQPMAHRPLVFHGPPSQWSCRCGYKFGLSKIVHLEPMDAAMTLHKKCADATQPDKNDAEPAEVAGLG
jgi:hypothetical protein